MFVYSVKLFPILWKINPNLISVYIQNYFIFCRFWTCSSRSMNRNNLQNVQTVSATEVYCSK